MRVLVVEDEQKLACDLQENLEALGFVAEICADGETAWFLGDTEEYDAIVLDIGLPQISGTTVLKKWRANNRNMPVIILTSFGNWTERVDGINAGADDYLAKPFQMEELIARLHAILRRSKGHSTSILVKGRLVLDPLQARVTVDGKIALLSPLEYRVLHYLMSNSPRIAHRGEILEHIYGYVDKDYGALEALMRRLRKKLGFDAIRNKRGFGYYIPDSDP